MVCMGDIFIMSLKVDQRLRRGSEKQRCIDQLGLQGKRGVSFTLRDRPPGRTGRKNSQEEVRPSR